MHKRLYYLDNLKTFALLLGVLFHTSIVYSENIGYAIKSEKVHYFFSVLVHFIHLFRMPLFFFLSGFFSFMVLQRKGGKYFSISRLERMVAPMVVGIITLAPIQYYLMYINKNESISFLKYYFKFFSLEEFNFSHIWFLVYLLIYSFLLLLSYKLKLINKLFKVSIEGIKSKLEGKKYIREILFSRERLFLNSVFFCFFSIFFSNLIFNKDYSFLRIQPVSFFYYMAYFSAGVIAYKNNLFDDFFIKDNDRKKAVTGSLIVNFMERQKFFTNFCFQLLGVVFLFCGYLYLDHSDPYWMNFTYSGKKILVRAFHLFLESSLAWLIIFILLVFFKISFDKSRPILDYLRNSGMSIYMIHHPISLILADYFIKVEMSIFLKFSIHTLLVFAISFLFYHFLIKKSFILKRAFGTK